MNIIETQQDSDTQKFSSEGKKAMLAIVFNYLLRDFDSFNFLGSRVTHLPFTALSPEVRYVVCVLPGQRMVFRALFTLETKLNLACHGITFALCYRVAILNLKTGQSSA